MVNRVSSFTGDYFNSRPSARGDLIGGVKYMGIWDFNSRPSARGDFVGKVLTGVQSVISIHAPPRGATRFIGF